VFGMVGRLAGLVTTAAIAAYGIVWISTPRGQPMHNGFALAAYEKVAAGEQPGAAPAFNDADVNAASSSNSGSFKPGGGATRVGQHRAAMPH